MRDCTYCWSPFTLGIREGMQLDTELWTEAEGVLSTSISLSMMVFTCQDRGVLGVRMLPWTRL